MCAMAPFRVIFFEETVLFRRKTLIFVSGNPCAVAMNQSEKILFERAVLEIVSLIPPGRATSYGAVARAAGYPDHARAVGRILGEVGPDCRPPAHRVVSSNGRLTGRYAFGSGSEMAALLVGEGVEVVDNSVRNWKKVLWGSAVGNIRGAAPVITGHK